MEKLNILKRLIYLSLSPNNQLSFILNAECSQLYTIDPKYT